MAAQRCNRCVYAGVVAGRWLRALAAGPLATLGAGWPTSLICINAPDAPGELREVAANGSCRNFRASREPPVRVPPPAPSSDAVRHIALTRGKHAIIDAADYTWLNRFRWHAKCSRGRYYAATVIDRKSTPMHRLIMDPPPGLVVDHIDGNGLNNTRANLRVCTPQQNRYNTRPTGKAPFVGVTRAGERFKATIKHNGRGLFLGYFDDPTDAARARDAAARKYHGHHAWLNFPDEPPPQ